MHTSKCLLLILHDSYSMYRESSFWATFDLSSSCLPFLLPSPLLLSLFSLSLLPCWQEAARNLFQVMQSIYPAPRSVAISPGFHFSTAWLGCLETSSGRSCSLTNSFPGVYCPGSLMLIPIQ